MTADILTIGDEILIGQITNTNSSYIARQLNAVGIAVNRMITIGDNKSEILSALKESGNRSDIVLITGGLGPTSDDITKPALCEYFNTELQRNDKVYAMVEKFVTRFGGNMNELNIAQADVPIAATIIYNQIGTAPGLWFEKDNVIYMSMPGVPFEMETMLMNDVLPQFKQKFNLPNIFHKTILTTGIGESKLALTIESWEKQLPHSFKLAYLPSPGMVKLRLSVYDGTNIEKNINEQITKLQTILGNAIYGFDNDTMESVIGDILKQNGKTVSTAESCTGGNISKLLTSISGSSEYFKGGVVAYSNDVKTNQLNVPSAIFEKFGAVSPEVVENMAKGAIALFNTDYSVAISGIAGPTGGTDEKPVGTVWIAVASKSDLKVQKFNFGDNRERNIARASMAALNMLRLFIS